MSEANNLEPGQVAYRALNFVYSCSSSVCPLGQCLVISVQSTHANSPCLFQDIFLHIPMYPHALVLPM